MATPILEQASKDLAYKLQDPVSAGTTSGVRITAAERLNYLVRAYRRLLRIVTLLYPELIRKLFQTYYSTTTVTTNSSGEITPTILPVAEVHELFAKEPVDEDYQKVTWISPEDFDSVRTGQNEFFNPDLNVKRYYWTRINDDIIILPSVTYACRISYRPDTISLILSGGYGGATDIDIPTEHLDLLLTIACIEAYMDIGQVDMVGLYKADMGEQLQLLASLTQKRERKDTNEEI